MKFHLKSFAMGALAATMLTGGLAMAKSGTESIEVLYDNIKIYIDNVLTEAKDADGDTVEPFVYNGTTYLPVRGVAEAMDSEVEWDGETKSVYIWHDVAPGGTYLTDILDPYEKSGNIKIENFNMLGEEYSHGFWNNIGASWDHPWSVPIRYNLNSKYSTLSFTLGHIDGHNTQENAGADIIVDGKTVKEIEIDPEAPPKRYSVALKKGLQLKIVMNGYVGMADVTLD